MFDFLNNIKIKVTMPGEKKEDISPEEMAKTMEAPVSDDDAETSEYSKSENKSNKEDAEDLRRRRSTIVNGGDLAYKSRRKSFLTKTMTEDEEIIAIKNVHNLGDKTFTTEQLKDVITQNLIYGDNEFQRKDFFKMLVICLINFTLSPIIGVVALAETFTTKYIKN